MKSPSSMLWSATVLFGVKENTFFFFLNRKQLWKRALDCCSQSGHNRSIGTYKTVNVVIIDNKSLAALGRGEVKKYTGGGNVFSCQSNEILHYYRIYLYLLILMRKLNVFHTSYYTLGVSGILDLNIEQQLNTLFRHSWGGGGNEQYWNPPKRYWGVKWTTSKTYQQNCRKRT